VSSATERIEGTGGSLGHRRGQSALASVARLQSRYPLLQPVALVGLFAYGAASIDGFSSSQSLRSMLVLASLLGLAALGQTLVVLLGGLDLSIPGFIATGAIVVTELCGAKHWALVPALVVVVVIAAVGGATSGLICHRFLIDPVIVTIGMGSLALGGCLAWTHATINGVPPALLSDLTAVNGATLGIPISPVVVIWAAVSLAMAVFLHRTPAGRRLYATGANAVAAELALVRTRLVWVVVFAGSATVSALVGVLLAGFSGADPSVGNPYLFQGLTAVIVGGTAFGGARGDYTHTVLGALILTELTTILVGHGFGPADEQIIFGLLILIVVAGYGRDQPPRDRV
jgi:ribose transport system permease protein